MITFYKKTQAQYDALSTYENDGIYFITDSKVIYLNGVRYGSNLSVVTEWPATGLVGILYVHSVTEEMRIFKDNNWVTVQRLLQYPYLQLIIRFQLLKRSSITLQMQLPLLKWV